MEEKDGQHDFGHAARHCVAPAFVPYDISGQGLQHPVDQEQHAEDHRQHEVPVMVAGKNQAACQQHKQPLGVAQHALPAHAAGRNQQGGKPLDDEEHGERIQGEVKSVVQRVDQEGDARQ
ncbi:hypothetical protein D3C73_1044150 [compost metagenome]